ncbi:MAG: hypothetical protein CM1200mP27_12070 [Chloroflexota bacterium]|nr:MAG: hypothetical protein CM1200mP27_12070 [Chloroflexota bacterium]
MVFFAIAVGGIIGGALLAGGTLLFEELESQDSSGLDQEYRDREIISCGEAMALVESGVSWCRVGSRIGSVGIRIINLNHDIGIGPYSGKTTMITGNYIAGNVGAE